MQSTPVSYLSWKVDMLQSQCSAYSFYTLVKIVMSSVSCSMSFLFIVMSFFYSFISPHDLKLQCNHAHLSIPRTCKHIYLNRYMHSTKYKALFCLVCQNEERICKSVRWQTWKGGLSSLVFWPDKTKLFSEANRQRTLSYGKLAPPLLNIMKYSAKF